MSVPDLNKKWAAILIAIYIPIIFIKQLLYKMSPLRDFNLFTLIATIVSYRGD